MRNSCENSPMKKKILAVHGFVEALVKIFNLGFFVLTGVLWLWIGMQSFLKGGFDLTVFWDSFNAIYGNFSFKVGCIFLIIFNGLGAVKAFLSQYLDLAEGVQHGGRVVRFLRGLLGR